MTLLGIMLETMVVDALEAGLANPDNAPTSWASFAEFVSEVQDTLAYEAELMDSEEFEEAYGSFLENHGWIYNPLS